MVRFGMIGTTRSHAADAEALVGVVLLAVVFGVGQAAASARCLTSELAVHVYQENHIASKGLRVRVSRCVNVCGDENPHCPCSASSPSWDAFTNRHGVAVFPEASLAEGPANRIEVEVLPDYREDCSGCLRMFSGNPCTLGVQIFKKPEGTVTKIIAKPMDVSIPFVDGRPASAEIRLKAVHIGPHNRFMQTVPLDWKAEPPSLVSLVVSPRFGRADERSGPLSVSWNDGFRREPTTTTLRIAEQDVGGVFTDVGVYFGRRAPSRVRVYGYLSRAQGAAGIPFPRFDLVMRTASGGEPPWKLSIVPDDDGWFEEWVPFSVLDLPLTPKSIDAQASVCPAGGGSTVTLRDPLVNTLDLKVTREGDECR